MINLKSEINNYLINCTSQKNLSSHTLKAYRIDLTQFLLFKENMSLSKSNLTEYIQELHTKYKPKTVKRKIASLKAFVHYLYFEDLIESNPFDKIDTTFKEPLLLPRTIPEHIIQQLLKVSYSNMCSATTKYEKLTTLRNTAIIELLFATGARISEICSLKLKDIDLTSKTVRIFGKGSKERIIQIENDDVISILMRYMLSTANHSQPDSYLFLNSRHNRLSEQSVRTVITNLEKQISSPIHITPHMFRHSVATLLLEEDVDIRYIQKILGHSSINTTQIYTHVTSSKQREILRTKHPRNKIHIGQKKNPPQTSIMSEENFYLIFLNIFPYISFFS